ncbi:MAG: cyclic nucleotide-binding domain-containing protein [Methyloprofundus sp.]|nr:cyclic nucleotide-binding domain-containing protein [Methyloprofundus sp.]
MPVDPKSEEGQVLRKLFPLETMPARQYNTLCSNINITEKPKGSFLFTRGDVPDSFIYLIEGTVSLEAEGLKIEKITAGTDSAKFAVAHQFPRQISARAMNKVRYVSLQLNAFDKQETEEIEDLEGESNYMVENDDDLEKEISGDWMSALLKSPIFQRLPAMNLQQVLMSLEDVEFKKGETIFKQGDSGEYYYLIKSGRCALSRKASERAKGIKLLELSRNKTFGEDALLSGELRSMTVTAMTDMLVSRINKERFIKLIKEPALTYIDYQQLLVACREDKAIAVDIRSADVYKENHIEGCRNIPFFSLRMYLKELSQETRKVIIICEDGQLSKAAAFVLIKGGVDTDVLIGGMQDVPEERESAGEAVFAIDESEAEAEESAVISEEKQELATKQEPEQASAANVSAIKEGADLEQENQRLQAENKRLTVEIEKVKKQYKMLYMQTGKLKAAFDKLKNSK